MVLRYRTIAKRYGRALFELALESGQIDQVAGDLGRLRQAAEGIPELVRGLADEKVGVKKRDAAACAVAKNMKLGKVCTNFLRLLIQKGRAELLPSILEDGEERFRAYRKLALAQARVADKAAAGDLKHKLEDVLGGMLGIEVRCEVQEDPKLIGGFTVKIGDEQFDASVQGKYARLKEALL
jgi:F-type H+-transporting ATPase subunit delta